MKSLIKNKQVKEFGDFQTPRELAFEVCLLLSRLGIQPETIVEPNCGIGGFLQASQKIFYSADVHGFDISSDYIKNANDKFRGEEKIFITQANFFETNWMEMFQNFSKPLLVLGNPPWVTSSELSSLESDNLPKKENFQKFSGFDALTGKSNFDISEWMLIHLFQSLNWQDASLAMLCKTSVARKVLKYAWKNNISISDSAIYGIETEKYFNASVDSCLLVCNFSQTLQDFSTKVYENLDSENPFQKIGFKNDQLIASIDLYEKWKHLNSVSDYKWRSGIKHDCSKVMELTKEGNLFENKLGETFELEDEFVFPMLKSSDLANGRLVPKRWMLVTQKNVSDDTEIIAEKAPKTWDYLNLHSEYLDKRKSSIYNNRAKYSVFGIGDYSFAPWKVAISGFYKRIDFNVVGNYENKPIVLDDTCYFIPCQTKKEAEKICKLLNSKIGKEFFEAYIFWDAKRPITIDLLKKLNISKLDKELQKLNN